ncbi:uncharacterized protein LOC143860891 [Tasmannia lanceolata]|uniref:uncharacterized protein LOC143860891 n=1 Tax=Tasmannia lanceolata TaxID=3420 RepID=UPI004064107A
MARGKTVAICQFGGEFISTSDGTMTYTGGEAHAIEVDHNMRFDDFKSEVAEMCQYDMCALSMKYFLPHNKRTLITVSNDKDLQRMVDFHEDSVTVDVYVLAGEIVAHNVSNVVDNRASRTTSRTTVVDSVPLKKEKALVASMTPLLSIGDPMDDVSPHRLNSPWENGITGLGQEFKSVRDFREALCKYALAKGFVYKFSSNDSNRVTAKCKGEGCPWRIHASKLPTVQKFMVKTMNDVHTCGGETVKKRQPHIKQQWIADLVKDKLRDNPDCTPKEITTNLYQDYGVNLTYQQAWRGKELAKEQLQGSQLEAYSQLPWLCERIMETNPGSLATLTTTDESRFHRLFVSFHASQHGFNHGCRPLLLLNKISLNKCPGILFAANAVDGDDGIFPVAFAVVEAETSDSWNWFLVQLKSVVSIACPITFVSNKHNGMSEAVPRVFEGSYHGHCLHYLMEDFKKDLMGSHLMVNEFKCAAYACTAADFNSCIDRIKNISQDAAAWVLASKPNEWSNAFFRGSRYDHLSSNIVDLFNNWMLEENELSVVEMVHMIRRKMMEMIYTRREASNMWSTTLTPSMEQKLQKEIFNSHSLNVFFSSDSVFEVRDSNSANIVNIETWECTCRRWQITGLPCMHSVAVFNRTGRNAYDYCSKYFTVDCYRLTYSESINPMPDLVDTPLNGEKPLNGDSTPITVVYPPRTRRPPGRPKSKKIEQQEMEKRARPIRCSKCKKFGHNKITCKEQ